MDFEQGFNEEVGAEEGLDKQGFCVCEEGIQKTIEPIIYWVLRHRHWAESFGGDI